MKGTARIFTAMALALAFVLQGSAWADVWMTRAVNRKLAERYGAVFETVETDEGTMEILPDVVGALNPSMDDEQRHSSERIVLCAHTEDLAVIHGVVAADRINTSVFSALVGQEDEWLLTNTWGLKEYRLFNIIDRQGALLGAFFARGDSEVEIMPNGAISVCTPTRWRPHVVMDRHANVLLASTMTESYSRGEYPEDGTVIYSQPGECGRLLRLTGTISFDEGSATHVEIVEPDGTVVSEVVSGRDVTVSKEQLLPNIFTVKYRGVSGGGGSLWLNIEDGTTEGTKWGGLEGSDFYRAYQAIHPSWPSGATVLNEGHYALPDGIYDIDGVCVYEANQPGASIQTALYGNGRYIIQTQNGWFYALNDRFERVMEPFQYGNALWYCADGYAIESADSATGYALYDYEGNRLAEVDGDSVGRGVQVAKWPLLGNLNVATLRNITIGAPVDREVPLLIYGG